MKLHDQKDPIYRLSIEKNIDENNSYFEREYNDNHNQATELINESEIIGAFYPKNDEDWFKFDLITKPISVNIYLSRIRGLDPIIEVYDSNLNLFKIISKNKFAKKVLLNDLSKGRYFVRIFSKEKSLLSYKLFFKVRNK